MSRDSDSDYSRRKFLIGTGAAGAVALAGCSSSSDTETEASGGSDDSEDESTETMTETGDSGSSSGGVDVLESGGSSTVYPVANTASSYWNANRPASDSEYWPWEEYGLDNSDELALADYWASLYGFEPDGDDSAPFRWTVGLSHSGTGVRKVRDGIYDIGNSSGNVEDELPDRDSYEKFVDHVCAVDGQPLVVSQEIADAGIEQITGDQLKGMYKGRITNWSEVGGPDREIRVLARVKGSGTRTSFVSNVFGDPEADTTVANRYGQNQRLAQAVADADNAISYLALAFIDTDGLAPVALEWEGTTYKYQDPENGLDSKEYPLSRDLHMYTWDGTDMREASVVNMMLHPFGQDTFVAPNNYFKLGERRLEEQRAKLPDQA
jgi:phosphate transport system substrate-binding protein